VEEGVRLPSVAENCRTVTALEIYSNAIRMLDSVKKVSKAEFLNQGKYEERIAIYDQYRSYKLPAFEGIVQIEEKYCTRSVAGNIRGFKGEREPGVEDLDIEYSLVPVVVDAYNRLVYGIQIAIAADYKVFSNDKGAVVKIVFSRDVFDQRRGDKEDDISFWKIKNKVRFRVMLCLKSECGVRLIVPTDWIHNVYVPTGRKFDPRLIGMKEVKKEKKKRKDLKQGNFCSSAVSKEWYIRYSKRQFLLRLNDTAMRGGTKEYQFDKRCYWVIGPKIFHGYMVF
jgi:hypothetical protein